VSLPVFSNAGFIQPLEIRQGADFSIELQFFLDAVGGEAYDLTGCEVRARVVPLEPAEGAPTSFDFTFVNDSPLDGIIEGTMAAAITATMTPSPTARLRDPDHRWDCDVKLADGTIVPFCRGPVTVIKGEVEWS
jgi:hypothetical protein